MPEKYERIFFLQGDEAHAVLDLMETASPEAALDDMVEKAKELVIEGTETHITAPWGPSDTHIVNAEGYVLSWNYSVGYVGLVRIVTEENKS